MLASEEAIKLLPSGLKRSKYKKLDSGDEEKNNVKKTKKTEDTDLVSSEKKDTDSVH